MRPTEKRNVKECPSSPSKKASFTKEKNSFTRSQMVVEQQTTLGRNTTDFGQGGEGGEGLSVGTSGEGLHNGFL